MLTLKQAVERLYYWASATKVAEFLRSCNVKGKRSINEHCPIARYLKMATGDNYLVYSFGIMDYHGSTLLFKHSEAVKDFLHAFDNDGYSDLAE